MPKITKVIPISSLVEGSDLRDKKDERYTAYNPNNNLYFFKYPKTYLKSGIYRFIEQNHSYVFAKTILKKKDVFKKHSFGMKITESVNRFFNNVDKYTSLGRIAKRGVLLHSKPGTGKTTMITNEVVELSEKDPNLLVIFWNTVDASASGLTSQLLDSPPSKKVTKILLIIEDLEQEGGSSALLNLLDGAHDVFKKPVFIIATTNHPEQLKEALSNRPGRFDEVYKVPELTEEDYVNLSEFFIKRFLTEEEKVYIQECKKFTVSHLEEAATRVFLDNITFLEGLYSMNDMINGYESGFTKKSKLGIE